MKQTQDRQREKKEITKCRETFGPDGCERMMANNRKAKLLPEKLFRHNPQQETTTTTTTVGFSALRISLFRVQKPRTHKRKIGHLFDRDTEHDHTAAVGT